MRDAHIPGVLRRGRRFMHASAHLSIHIRTSAYMSIHGCTHVYAHTMLASIHTSVRMRTHMYIHTTTLTSIQDVCDKATEVSESEKIHEHIYKHCYTCVYICRHTCLCTCLDTCIYLCLYTWFTQAVYTLSLMFAPPPRLKKKGCLRRQGYRGFGTRSLPRRATA